MTVSTFSSSARSSTMSAASTKRIQKELSKLTSEPLDNIAVEAEGDRLDSWKVVLAGPKGTPYAGGKFLLKCVFSPEYPFKAPTVTVQTRTYHPNIDSDGNVCVGILKADSWKPATSMSQVLVSLYDLFEVPNPDDPLVTSIAEQFVSDRAGFDKKAKEYTQNFAV